MNARHPEALLIRGPSTDEGTFGVLTFGSQSVFSLELPWRANRVQKSCIPLGRYLCVLTRSPKFGRVYHVMDVPGRSSVLIHSANFAGDVALGYTSQLQGCIAPFERQGMLRTPAGELQRAGLLSRPALSKIMLWGAGNPFWLKIDES
jgi:hypothetical protein